MRNYWQYLAIFIVTAILVALSFVYGRKTAPNSPVKEQRDTIILTETQWREKPVYLTKRETRVDTFLVHSTDTIERTRVDTVYVPISQYYYNELDGRLRIWVSGYDVCLDRFELDEQTKVITDKVRKRWGFSVGVGPSVIYTPFHKDCPIDAGIGIFGGFTYNF